MIGITEEYDPVFTNDWRTVGGKVEVCGEPGLECFGCISKLDLDTLRVDLKKEVGKVCKGKLALA